jgi:hypothetical protein
MVSVSSVGMGSWMDSALSLEHPSNALRKGWVARLSSIVRFSISKLFVASAALPFVVYFWFLWCTFESPSALSDGRALQHPLHPAGQGRYQALTRFQGESGENRKTPLQSILEGHYTLVGIHVPLQGLTIEKDTRGMSSSTDYVRYSGVDGVFCPVDWSHQVRNPSLVPMFRALLRKSGPSCTDPSNHVTWDLADIAARARAHDISSSSPAVLSPALVVFHESRCGSTLVANVLAASGEVVVNDTLSSVRVYSESPPPIAALRACDASSNPMVHCDPGTHESLIQDVFYLMGRIPTYDYTGPRQVYYKIQSVGSRYINAFAAALPTTPWAFVYRDSIEVVMSHLKDHLLPVKKSRLLGPLRPTAVCLRSFRQTRQHPLLRAVISRAASVNNSTTNWKHRLDLTSNDSSLITSLTAEGHCAAYLASLCEAAIQQYEQYTPVGSQSLPSEGLVETRPRAQSWLLNYQDLPTSTWDKVLPSLLNRTSLSADQTKRMKEIAASYSKGRGARSIEWQDDREQKQKSASESVKEAVRIYLDPSYGRLNEIRDSLIAGR